MWNLRSQSYNLAKKNSMLFNLKYNSSDRSFIEHLKLKYLSYSRINTWSCENLKKLKKERCTTSRKKKAPSNSVFYCYHSYYYYYCYLMCQCEQRQKKKSRKTIIVPESKKWKQWQVMMRAASTHCNTVTLVQWKRCLSDSVGHSLLLTWKTETGSQTESKRERGCGIN